MKKVSQQRTDIRPPWLEKLEAATGGPYRPEETSGTVYLLVDTSGSMSTRSKMEQARNGAADFAAIAADRGYALGVISFGREARYVRIAGHVLEGLPDQLKTLTPDGNTDMAAGLELARKTLAEARGERVVCIVTDGMPDSQTDTLAEAKAAKRQGIEIMAVGTDDADRAFLDRLVTRKELARKVERPKLRDEITSMAHLLPKPS